MLKKVNQHSRKMGTQGIDARENREQKSHKRNYEKCDIIKEVTQLRD